MHTTLARHSFPRHRLKSEPTLDADTISAELYSKPLWAGCIFSADLVLMRGFFSINMCRANQSHGARKDRIPLIRHLLAEIKPLSRKSIMWRKLRCRSLADCFFFRHSCATALRVSNSTQKEKGFHISHWGFDWICNQACNEISLYYHTSRWELQDDNTRSKISNLCW